MANKNKTMGVGVGGLVALAVGGSVMLTCCCGNPVLSVLLDARVEVPEVDEPAPTKRTVTDPSVDLEPLRSELDRCVKALEGDDFDGANEAWHAAQEVVLGFTGDLSTERAVLTAMTNEVGLIDCRGGKELAPGKRIDALRCDRELQAIVDALPEVSDDHHLRPHLEATRTRIAAVQAKLAPAAEEQRKEAAEEAALLAKCGPEPVPDGFDASVAAAEAYMRARVTVAPDSINVQCASAVMTPNDCWMLNCRVTGKNAFGVEVVEPHHFYLGAGSGPDSADRVKAMR